VKKYIFILLVILTYNSIYGETNGFAIEAGPTMPFKVGYGITMGVKLDCFREITKLRLTFLGEAILKLERMRILENLNIGILILRLV